MKEYTINTPLKYKEEEGVERKQGLILYCIKTNKYR